MPDLTLIIPTLDLDVGKAAMTRARDMAGCDLVEVIGHDAGERMFTHTVNKCLQGIDTPYVAIMSDDCEPRTEYFLQELMMVLDVDDTWGFACPTMPCRTPPICEQGGPADEPVIQQVDSVPFGCVVIKHAVLEQVGALDEQTFTHYCSDTDHQYRSREHGWKSVWAQHVYVHRELHPPREPQWTLDRIQFLRRYGRV